MNNRKLIDYLPPVLKSISELVVLHDAQQPEIENAWSALRAVMNNQFIDTATEEGVSIWEQELDILPHNTDTLEDRKHRIKTAWFYAAVYTYHWLCNWMKTTCGDDSIPDLKDYTLNVTLPISVDYMKIFSDMRKQIPANIIINPSLILTKTKSPLYVGVSIRSCIVQKIGYKKSLLSDENGYILTDEDGALLVD